MGSPTVPDIAAHGAEPSLGQRRAQPGSRPRHLPGTMGHSTSRSRIQPSPGATKAAREPCSASHGHHRTPVPRPSPTLAHSEGSGTHSTGTPPRLPPPRPPLPACTVRRRKRKAEATQPQRRAATGRAPVSLAMASQAHLPGLGAVPARRLCRPGALPALPARAATSIGGNWDRPLPREQLPAPVHPTLTPDPSPASQAGVKGCPGEPRHSMGTSPFATWEHPPGSAVPCHSPTPCRSPTHG